MRLELLAGYPASDADEAVVPGGALRPEHLPLEPALRRLGAIGLDAAAVALADERRRRELSVAAWVDGRQVPVPFVQDPWPRILPAADWRHLAAGAEQRHRALSAFLADAYRAAGRRRSDPDRDPEIVRAGVLPGWAVAHSPGRSADAVGMAWPGQPRAALAAVDVVRTVDGGWTAVGEDLRAPAGLGFAIVARDVVRTAVPALAPGGQVLDPVSAVPLLRAALLAAAPPACSGTPAIALLTEGSADSTYADHRLLARALDVPLVQAGDVWPRADGGIEVQAGSRRVPIDVLYRRFDDVALRAYRAPLGQPLDGMLAGAVRAGRLGLANVPGNGVADDVTTHAFVPAMIRFYLGEEPLLRSAETWLLADPGQWAQVRDRLHELVVEPVESYGGPRSDAVVGPTASAAELAQTQAEVAAAPHRFVAREVIEPSTVPTLVDGVLRPRHVGLRVFSAAAPDPRALPAPLTRVAMGADPRATDAAVGGGSKDTWILG